MLGWLASLAVVDTVAPPARPRRRSPLANGHTRPPPAVTPGWHVLRVHVHGHETDKLSRAQSRTAQSRRESSAGRRRSLPYSCTGRGGRLAPGGLKSHRQARDGARVAEPAPDQHATPRGEIVSQPSAVVRWCDAPGGKHRSKTVAKRDRRCFTPLQRYYGRSTRVAIAPRQGRGGQTGSAVKLRLPPCERTRMPAGSQLGSPVPPWSRTTLPVALSTIIGSVSMG